MRISDIYTSSAAASQTARTTGAEQVSSESRKAAAAENRPAADHVVLSSGDLVGKALHATSPERQSRVAAITQQYQAGKYTVDPEALAKALLTKLG